MDVVLVGFWNVVDAATYIKGFATRGPQSNASVHSFQKLCPKDNDSLR